MAFFTAGPFNTGVDFLTECLLVGLSFSAKPSHVVFTPILSMATDEQDIYFERGSYDDGVYAFNSETVTHVVIEAVIINKSDLPANNPESLIYRKQES